MPPRAFRNAALALAAVVLVAGLPLAAEADEGRARTPSPPGARVYFISPADGDVVSSPVVVRFGLSGMGVAPATVAFPNTGHHHLLIDSPLPDFDSPVPADPKHVHFGTGLTETTIELSPGTHTLQLLLGDDRHVPHDPPVHSESITITVQ